MEESETEDEDDDEEEEGRTRRGEWGAEEEKEDIG